MGQVHNAISDELREFIAAQPMFFVATAPLSDKGRINLSPKGHNTFKVLSPSRVAYLDLTGSGNEASAHLLENGRITFMFCAFEGPPRILRLYGSGRVLMADLPDWAEYNRQFEALPGARQIIVAEISRVQTSCGFAVPRMKFVEQRDTLVKWADSKGRDGLVAYHKQKNMQSIDGLPAPLRDFYERPGH